MNTNTPISKTSLKDELKIIPKVAWVVIGILLIAWMGVLYPFLLTKVQGHGPDPIILGIASLLGVCFLSFWLLLIFYVNADAGRRGMSRTLWTLLSIFIPYGIGILVYFIMRHPILISCPGCKNATHPDFLFCPHCGRVLKSKCPNCQHTVEPGWMSCAYCGSKL